MGEFVQYILVLGGFVLTTLVAVVAFFLRRLLADHDSTKLKLDTMEKRFEQLKLSIEQNFVSFDTFQTLQDRFIKNFEKLFDSQAANGAILARLDERSKSDDRLAQVLEILLQRKK